jgi:hypothetical protein
MKRKIDPRLADTRVIPGSGNVFVDLGFDEAEAQVMALRVEWDDASAQVAGRRRIDPGRSSQAAACDSTARIGAGQGRMEGFQRGHAADAGGARRVASTAATGCVTC